MHTSVARQAPPVQTGLYKWCVVCRPVARRPIKSSRAQARVTSTVYATATKEDVQEVQESSNDGRKMDESTPGLLSWEEIGQRAGADVLHGYQILDLSSSAGQPRTAPTRVLPTKESTTTDKPVLLYRDTNAWCPFCERVCNSSLLSSKQALFVLYLFTVHKLGAL